MSYVQLGPKKILAAVSPHEVVEQYEAPFRALGLHPGLVTISSLAMLELVPEKTAGVIAKLSAGVLTVTAIQPSGILLIRSLDLDPAATDHLEEISNDLYPTLAYIEDNTGTRPQKLLIAGFGEESTTAATRLAVELELEVEPMADTHPGLMGYLQTLPSSRRSSGKRKVAA